MKVLLVGENASARMGGEAAAPFHYFRLLPNYGADVWLVAHARVREELYETFPDRRDRMRFVEDSFFDKLLFSISRRLPDKVAAQTFGVVGGIVTQFRLRRVVLRLIDEIQADLVHQVYPISPKAPSAMHGFKVPVVIGPPLSGGMRYPAGFRHREGLLSRMVEWCGRRTANLVNRFIPGKLRAAALLVANPQTREALPKGCRGRVYDDVSEVSIDARVFSARPAERSSRPTDDPVRYVFLGRLVDWKAVDLLLEAFAIAAASEPGRLRLDILGDGPKRSELEGQAQRLGISEIVTFVGWVAADAAAERLRQSDVFVLPSLRESGGIVLVEVMAAGLPVIATDWGGPALTVKDSFGIKVPPTTPQGFVTSLADAIVDLAKDPDRRLRLGQAAAARVRENYLTWEHKAERTAAIYRETLELVSMTKANNRPEDVQIWGCGFARYTLPNAVDAVTGLIRAGRPTWFVTANVHTLMAAAESLEMQASLQEAAFVLADGMPIVLASRLRPRKLPGRVAGADLLPALCERAAREGWRIFFLGGPPGVGAEAAEQLTARFPGLQIVGVESPPFRPLSPTEETEQIARIQEARPDLLVVLFGQPKGEIWIRERAAVLRVAVSVQMGATLDFVAGRVRRAPRWVQRIGMEWLYRISREPRRLTGRYLRNGLFLARMLLRDLWRLIRRQPLD